MTTNDSCHRTQMDVKQNTNSAYSSIHKLSTRNVVLIPTTTRTTTTPTTKEKKAQKVATADFRFSIVDDTIVNLISLLP